MHRIPRRCAALVLALAAAGTLAGCGSDDSTASSKPTLTPSVDASGGGPNGQVGPTTAKAQTNPGPAATAPPEAPQAAPGGSSNAPQPGPKEQAFIDALKQGGVGVSGNGDTAITIANYICAGVKQGQNDDQLASFVNAMAGVEGGLTGSKLTPEAAGKIYVSVAKSTYCK